MTVIQYISISIFLFAVFLIVSRKKNDLLSPSFVFIIIWSLSIFITELKFSQFQFIWSSYSWFVLLLGLVSFLIGSFICHTSFVGQIKYQITDIRNKFSVTTFDLNKLEIATYVIFIFYLIAFIIEVILFGELPIFSSKPDRARMDFGVFGLHLLVNQIPVILILCVQYWILNYGRSEKNIVILFIFLTSFFSYLLLLQRLNYFLFAVVAFVLFYYLTHAITFKRLIIFLLLIGTLLWFIQSIRISAYAAQFFYITSHVKYSSDYAFITAPYMYIVMNLENFAKGVQLLERNSYGLLTFEWLFSISGLKNWLSEYFSINYREFVRTGYNTYPFLWSFYFDFGVIGVTILSLGAGYISSLIYNLMRTTLELRYFVIYGVILFGIIMSFFTNIFSSLNTVSNLIILWFVNSIIYKSNNLK